MNVAEAKRIALADKWPTTTGDAARVLADEVDRLSLSLAYQENISQGRAEENERLRQDVADLRDLYHAQLEAVHDLTETLAEERVQHAAQVERIRAEYVAEMARAVQP